MQTLVIGLGNPLATDDSVGLRVAADLRSALVDREDVEVVEDYWGGVRLVQRMVDFDRAIIVDVVSTGAAPGTIHHLRPDEMTHQRSRSPNDLDLATALKVARRSDVALPADDRIEMVAIEAEDVANFSRRCTPEVHAAVPQAVADVLTILEQ